MSSTSGPFPSNGQKGFQLSRRRASPLWKWPEPGGGVPRGPRLNMLLDEPFCGVDPLAVGRSCQGS